MENLIALGVDTVFIQQEAARALAVARASALSQVK